MSALAIFSCRPNSHPFQERHVSVHEPVKIGRSVARARAALNNAIFDCKVLSRNHALLWYENGKFYLQDTKSSNGTFINNHRLSKGSEESSPREIYSGDIVQFGVDVMENSRRVTHGCIIASITLYHPDGTEAKPDQLSPFLNAAIGGTSIQSQELYQLAQCLQEALHREQLLENKLATLQRLLQNTQEASDTGWQAFIDEDRLLSRLEVLENQLQVYSRNQTEDTLRGELVALQEDKLKYETTAKESLRRVLQEKLEAVRKLSELEKSLGNTEEECTHLKEMCEMSQKELHELAVKHQEQIEEVASLTEKLQEAEKGHQDEIERLENEKKELKERIEEMEKQEDSLNAKVESLQADGDFTKEQLANIKVKMESIKESEVGSILSKTEEQGIQVDVPLIEEVAADDEIELQDKQDKNKENNKQIEEYKAQIKESENRLIESKEKIESLQSDLEEAQAESAASLSKVAALENQLKLSDLHMNQMLENTVSDIKMQFLESQKQAEIANELVVSLKDQIKSQEKELSEFRASSEYVSVREECANLRQRIQDIEVEMKRSRNENNTLQQEYSRLEQSYKELESLKIGLEARQSDSLNNLTDAQKEADQTSVDLNDAKMSVVRLEEQCAHLNEEVTNLRDELVGMTEEYELLSYRTKTLSMFAMLPLIMLLIAFLLAMSPWLASVTATTTLP